MAEKVPTEEEFKSWLLHPVTQALKVALEAEVAGIQLDWVNGTFTGATADETLQLNANAIGRSQALARVAEMEYSDFIGSAS
jgi:hypothetical protein